MGATNPYSPYGINYSPFPAYYPSLPAPPPIPVGKIESVSALEVKGEYAYFVFVEGISDATTEPNSETSLRVADLSNPEEPDIVKIITLDYPVSDIFLHGNYLYWLSETNLWNLGYSMNEDEYILGVFDISDPVSPAMLDTLTLKLSSQGPFAFSFNENRLYILYRKAEEDWSEIIHKLVVIDISNPGDLTQLSIGQMELDDSIIHEMTVKDDLAILSGGYIFDISNPEHPSLVSTVEDNGSRLGRHAVFGNYLLLIAEDKGLWIVDIEDPSQPELVTTIELSWPKEIILKGQRAYISDHCKGLNVVDLADPENPELLHGYRLPSYKMYRGTSNSSGSWLGDMDIGEGLAFTLSYSNIQIWDISERGNVRMAGRIGPSHEPEDFAESIIPGKLVLLLSQDAKDLVSLGQDGDIATFGIDTLDELNREYGIYTITQETSSNSEVPPIISVYDNYAERTYSIEFPKSVDMYDIWDAYMDNPYCLIAEFLYEPDSGMNGSPASSGGGYAVVPFIGGNAFGTVFGYGGMPYSYGAYSGNPFQGTNLLQGSFGISAPGYSSFGLINPLRYGSEMTGIVSSSPRTSLSSVFQGGNRQLPGQSYWPGSLYPTANSYGSIYQGGNYPMSYPFTVNPLIANINPLSFNNYYQHYPFSGSGYSTYVQSIGIKGF